MTQSVPPPHSRVTSNGFSLVELLVVVAIIGLLATFALPAFHSIASAGNVARGAHDVAGLLELARSEAVARQTYVWVGIVPTTEAGNSAVRLAAVYSLDGTGTNTAAINFGQLSKVLLVRDVVLTNWSGLKTATRDRFPSITPASVSTNANGVDFEVGGTRFSAHTITFSPRGEALLAGPAGPYEGYEDHLDLSLVQARGTTVVPNADDAAIIVNGATGIPAIVQLQ